MRVVLRPSTLPLIALLASVGCASELLSANCTDQANAGIVLTLEDSTTGARHPFTDIVAVAAEGLFRDTARVASITSDPHSVTGVPLVFERAGTYSVTVQATGYALWTTNGVRVVEEDNLCRHVIPVHLVARLRPQATP